MVEYIDDFEIHDAKTDKLVYAIEYFFVAIFN